MERGDALVVTIPGTPPKALSPNGRPNRYAKNKAAQQLKQDAFHATQEAVAAPHIRRQVIEDLIEDVDAELRADPMTIGRANVLSAVDHWLREQGDDR